MTERAILYARVSNRSQDERGLSIPAQFAELRAWCDREGVRVVGQVADTGGKRSKRDDLERAGLDELYDTAERLRLVEGDVVLAQSWDRFGENDVPGWIGRRLASVCGGRLRTPDDPNEGDDDGADLLRLVGRWNAGRERRLMARRTRSRKLELARTGHIVPSHTPTYGFAYAGEHKARLYEVHEGRAAVVRRIFAEVADGTGIRTIVRLLDAEGVPLPPGKKRPGWRGWNREFVRNLIRNDVHLPHTDDELDALVAAGHLRPEVRSRAAAGCGIWWYTGKDYEGDAHAVAVPVPSVGVPRATVEKARARLASNRPASSAAGRFWTLSRGIMICGGCGRNMATHTVGKKDKGKVHRYYRCQSTGDTIKGTCPNPVHAPAERAEAAVWEWIVDLECEPRRIVALPDRRIEVERRRLRGDPEKEARELRRRIDDTAVRRANYQDQQAEGLMTIDELRARLEALAEERAGLERQIEECGRLGEGLLELEELRGYYAAAGPGGWMMRNAVSDATEVRRMRMLEETGGPDQRRRYEALGLRATAVSRDMLEISSVFGTGGVDILTTSPSPPSTPTTPRPPLRA